MAVAVEPSCKGCESDEGRWVQAGSLLPEQVYACRECVPPRQPEVRS